MPSYARLRSWWSALPSRRGFVYDVATFFAGLASFELSRRWVRMQPSASNKVWGAPEIMANRPLVAMLLIAWVSFIVGVSLKRNGLQRRLALKEAPLPPPRIATERFISAPFFTCVLYGMVAAWAGLVRGYSTLPLLLLPPAALLRAFWRPRSVATAEPPWREHLGDFLLFVTLIPLQILLRQFCSELEPGSWLGALALVGLFYVVPRIIYLVEDADDWRTWLRMIVVMAPMALRA